GIESIAVLFTDLVGSTAMYSRTGDAPAFRIVTDHFTVIRDIVSRYEGAIVKTIGDAVMAVFIDAGNCLRAAVELDRSVQGITWDGAPLRLRAGMHAGPCIAMRANERIDYFGTTVNLAARLESAAGAGEVTMARADAQRAGVAPLLREFGDRAGSETLEIKGFARPIDVVRLRVF
ncbi:MAG TPA: adenylate/guanylate cyclase domain-containing protein, partial [Candidatus Baltobacteraceae bacterium]|nr:adenylate/guanylate cyclase domain-containing protein [Candidatus Baltobacteraceae bacterium]